MVQTDQPSYAHQVFSDRLQLCPQVATGRQLARLGRRPRTVKRSLLTSTCSASSIPRDHWNWKIKLSGRSNSKDQPKKIDFSKVPIPKNPKIDVLNAFGTGLGRPVDVLQLPRHGAPQRQDLLTAHVAAIAPKNAPLQPWKSWQRRLRDWNWLKASDLNKSDTSFAALCIALSSFYMNTWV